MLDVRGEAGGTGGELGALLTEGFGFGAQDTEAGIKVGQTGAESSRLSGEAGGLPCGGGA